MQLNGLHHVTAITGEVQANLAFYTQVLGMRLVKKTVNQDDVSAYHLFYADKAGSPGTDMTFFDWPHIDSESRGTDSIITTVFRVRDEAALDFWQDRFSAHAITSERITITSDRAGLYFSDPEGQRLMLVPDGGMPFEGEPWDGSDVPVEFALRGFYAVIQSVVARDPLDRILVEVLQMRRANASGSFMGREMAIYEMAEGGPGRQLWVIEEPGQRLAHSGAGGVHHVAFRVPDKEIQRQWLDRVRSARLPASDMIDRFYFNSIYFRVSRGILFEVATDGPGFTADEAAESLGEGLALPPFLEARREQIEAGLKPL